MKLMPEKDDITDYLSYSHVIDYDNKLIQKKAKSLTKGISGDIEKARIIYEFVRDEIHHSSDINSKKVTYQASDVLFKGHGLCFAKSHLLAALLRCEKIPTGFCYQKLSISTGKILHGLNGVFIDEKWVRLDARGNNAVINAQFSLNKEKLAYTPHKEMGDVNYPYIYSEPCPKIIKILQNYSTLDEVINHIVASL
ncbi:MAG TPA: transglutaminase-like domain-containing protein [Methanobacteriaceae archaeon]|nr:transglutaminase-like domain-containing protein [Methanobacteriaceae archaeon]